MLCCCWTNPVSCYSCSHMLSCTTIPGAKFPCSTQHSCHFTGTHTAALKLAKRCAHTHTHTISRGNLFYFLQRKKQWRGWGQGELCDPVFTATTSAVCTVWVFMYMANVCMWTAGVYMDSGRRRRPQSWTLSFKSFPLPSLHFGHYLWILSLRISLLPDKRRQQKSRKRQRGLWLCSPAGCIKSPGRGT